MATCGNSSNYLLHKMDAAPDYVRLSAEIRAEKLLAGDEAKWFVMRDLTRHNARLPAYKLLDGMDIRNFTPMVWKIHTVCGRRERLWQPVIHDLLFVCAPRSVVDRIVSRVPTFQYRYVRGGYKKPMTVRDADMRRFIDAVSAADTPKYYRPDEVTPDMRRRRIRIIGGRLDGYEGSLVTTRGSRVKRLLVELPTLLAATVEVEPEFIQLL